MSSEGIAVRAGNHCSKLNKIGDDNNTVRISFAFYNTFKEIDYLYNVLKNTSIETMIKAVL